MGLLSIYPYSNFVSFTRLVLQVSIKHFSEQMTSYINLQSYSIFARLSSASAVSLRGRSQSAATICLATRTRESFPMHTEMFSWLSLFLQNSVAYRRLLPLRLTLSFSGSYHVSLAGVRRGTQISLQHSVKITLVMISLVWLSHSSADSTQIKQLL